MYTTYVNHILFVSYTLEFYSLDVNSQFLKEQNIIIKNYKVWGNCREQSACFSTLPISQIHTLKFGPQDVNIRICHLRK